MNQDTPRRELPVIQKAVIPAAGLGTRHHPISKFIPKEMLPVAGRPMIQYCVEEAIISGIKKLCVVISPGKEIIKDYLLSENIVKFPIYTDRDKLREIIKDCEFTFVYQNEPRGLVDAIAAAENFVGSERFVIFHPDTVLISGTPALVQMRDSVRGNTTNLVALYKIPRHDAPCFSRSGLHSREKISGREYRITRIYEKEKGVFQGGEVKTTSPEIIQPQYFEYAREFINRKKPGQEVDEVALITKMIANTGLTGYLLDGVVFDVGNTYGYAAANRWFAKQNLCPDE